MTFTVEIQRRDKKNMPPQIAMFTKYNGQGDISQTMLSDLTEEEYASIMRATHKSILHRILAAVEEAVEIIETDDVFDE